MKQIIVNSQSVFLMHYLPDWENSFDCEFSIINDSERGLTGREDRVPLSTSLRTALSFDVLLERQQAAEFRASLRAIGNTPVLCPFWPAASEYHGDKTFYVFGDGTHYVDSDGDFYVSGETNETKTARLSSGLMLCYEPDWSAFSVYPVNELPSFEPSPSAVKVPVLWGRFSPAPKPEAVTDELLSVTVDFVENSSSDMALAAAELVFSSGPIAAGNVRKMFPLRPNWKGINFGEAVVEINSDEIGYRRETADAFYPQTAVRSADQQFICSSWAEVHSLIRFFYDSVGTVKNFWLPAFVGDCRLTSPTTAGSDIIEVDNAAGLGAASHFTLISRDYIETFGVDSIGIEDGTIELSNPVGNVFDPGETLVSPLLLARFKKSKIKVSFTTDNIAKANLQFVEVPEEYETIIGDDPGEQSKTAFLYRLTLSGYDPWLFTSHESRITYGSDTYIPSHFDHSTTKEDINLDKNELTLRSLYFWHPTEVSLRNPLGYFLPFRLESPLKIEIMECQPDKNGDIADTKTVFSGSVITASFDGPTIKAKCRNIGSMFDRQIPIILIQPTCNYSLYSTACGVDSGIWKMSAGVVSYDGAHTLIIGQPDFSDLGAARPDHALFEHFFAGGKMEAGSGNTFERRSILDSVAFGDNIQITIRHPLENTPESVFIWPGCDGRKETCQLYHVDDNPDGKFDNYKRFGGFPFVPLGNPSVLKVSQNVSAGGKK